MKIRRLNEDAKRFYVDEIVSAQGGKTETERHSFATIDELKQYCKDAGLTKDDIANCGGCNVRDICENLVKDPYYDSLAINEPKIYLPTDKGNKVEVSIGAEKQDEDDWDIYVEIRDNGDFCFEIPSSRLADEIGEIRNPRLTYLTYERAEELCNQIHSYFEDIDQDDIYTTLVNKLGCNKTKVEQFWNAAELQEDLNEDAPVSKLHTKPNGEYLVKAASGKGYTAFSRDNVAIGGIDNEDAESDDKAIAKFKKNEYSECLNEAYFDTPEYRILKYEEDIPELMAGMHDDYMEGKLAAEFYAKALEKVYNALADCDYKHTMSQAVKTETNSQKILNALDKAEPKTINDAARVVEENITEGAEKCYAAKYTAVDSEGNKTQKKICFMCDGTIEDAEKEVDALIKEPYTELKVIGSCLKGVAEKDGFVFVESCNSPVRNKSTCGKRSLKESFDEVGTFTYRYVPDDIDDLPEDVLEKYTEEQIEEFIESKNIPDDLWLTSEAFITYEGGSYQVSHGGWDDYRFHSTIDDCIEDVEGWYDIFEWIDDVSDIEYSAPDEEDYDEYDDDYSDDYDESLEECSGIKAHKIIMGEGIDDIGLDDTMGVEGPTGDKTSDIEFVMEEYIAPNFLIDTVNKLTPTKYEVTYNGKTVLLEFDPKWSEYVYTINGKGPHSHSSYEWILSDIRDYVNTFCSADNMLDDEF